MARELDQLLHDYVDGRLSTVEREEFEAAMALDPSLASKVATYRAMGDALRGGEDELDEAFYAKARERFENSRRPWIERLWSWEAASLLAAAALAFALFLPVLFEDGQPDPVNGAAVAMEELERVAPRADTVKSAPEGAPVEVERQIAGERLVDPPAAGMADDSVAAPEPAAPGRDAPAADAEPAPPLKKVSVGKAERREKQRPEQPSPVEQRAVAESLESVSPKASTERRRDLRLRVVRMPVSPPLPISQPTLEEWRLMVGDPRFDALATLGAPTADRRLLWVGDSLDCDRLTAAREADAWRVELYPGDDIACALLLPADGLRVTAATRVAP